MGKDAERTIRQRNLIAMGKHPLTGAPLLGRETCGTCAFAIMYEYGRSFWKCKQIGGGSAATYLRKWWPACMGWKAKEDVK